MAGAIAVVVALLLLVPVLVLVLGGAVSAVVSRLFSGQDQRLQRD